MMNASNDKQQREYRDRYESDSVDAAMSGLVIRNELRHCLVAAIDSDLGFHTIVLKRPNQVAKKAI